MNTLFILYFITTRAGFLPAWPLTRQKSPVEVFMAPGTCWPLLAAERTHIGGPGRRRAPALREPARVHRSWASTPSRWRARAGCTAVACIREPAQRGCACRVHLLQPFDKPLPDGLRGAEPGPALLPFSASPWLLSRCHHGGLI